MVRFKIWLEALEEYKDKIRDAVLRAIKELLELKDDINPDEVLNQDLKHINPNDVKELIRKCNHKILSQEALDSILGDIRNAKNHEPFTVQKLIDRLSQEEQPMQTQQKTFAPSNNNPPPQPATPQVPPQSMSMPTPLQ